MGIAGKSHRLVYLAALGLAACLALRFAAQEDPRRRSDLTPIDLPGGSRVEFKAFFSKSLNRQQQYSIFLPPGYGRSKKSYPVVYFLHGLNNNHTSWTVDRYGSLQEKIERMILSKKIPEIIMVHPDGDNSFYTNSADGSLRFEDFIVADMIEHVEKEYRARSGRQNRAIAGTSMGGYGALKIAFKHPQLYSAVAAHSPIVLSDGLLNVAEEVSGTRFYQFFRAMLGRIFGDPIDKKHWEENDLLVLARRGNLKGLRIFFDYGTADRYISSIRLDEGCRALHRALERAGVRHIFKEREGEPHGWALVNSSIEESLPFLCQDFRN